MFTSRKCSILGVYGTYGKCLARHGHKADQSILLGWSLVVRVVWLHLHLSASTSGHPRLDRTTSRLVFHQCFKLFLVSWAAHVKIVNQIREQPVTVSYLGIVGLPCCIAQLPLLADVQLEKLCIVADLFVLIYVLSYLTRSACALLHLTAFSIAALANRSSPPVLVVWPVAVVVCTYGPSIAIVDVLVVYSIILIGYHDGDGDGIGPCWCISYRDSNP